MRLPEFESDSKDRELIREGLDQWSQVDHNEDAQRLIDILDRASGLEGVMEEVDYMTIESYGKINPERISERVAQKIEGSMELYDEAKEGKTNEIKKIHIKTAVRNFLVPVNMVNTNEKWCGDCCNIAKKKISIGVGKDLERVMNIEKIITGKLFLESLGKMIDVSKELQCEIPGAVEVIVMEKEKKIALSEIDVGANAENTLVLKDECYKKERLASFKKTPQKIREIVRDYHIARAETQDHTERKKIQDQVKESLNEFSIIDLQNVFDEGFKARNKAVFNGKKNEVIGVLADEKYTQISSYRHCTKGEALKNLLEKGRNEDRKRIGIHVQPENTAMSKGDSKSLYIVDLKLGEQKIMAQIIVSQEEGNWAIYFNEGGYHHKIEVRGKDVYKPTKISQKLFDVMVEVCKKT